MVSALAVAGRVGLLAVGDDLEQARRLYRDVKDALGEAAADVTGAAAASAGVTRQGGRRPRSGPCEDEPFVIPVVGRRLGARMLAALGFEALATTSSASRSRSDRSTAT